VQKLDQLLGLYGEAPLLLRSEDISLHDDSAQTLREKKVSDLHNRVALVDELPGAVLLSIHQNSLPSSPSTRGAQVFWNRQEGAEELASSIQESLNGAVNAGHEKKAAQVPSSVYLMKEITAPGVLVECGFLSNAAETEQLKDPAYQTKLAAAIAFTVLLRNSGYLTHTLYIPFFNVEFPMPWWLYMAFAAFVMVGTVNAVNLTDGIDGLATGVTMPVMLFFTAVACFWGQLELGIFSAGLFGGLCGFLIYNFHPAKVFMGDTGSLFLGGAVCGLAFALDIPLVLILVGIIYILETLSDILQVGYFKLTHGKRIFRMAPLHHHLELGGWSEVKLFCVFSGVTLLACVLAFLGVMGR